MYNYIYSRSVRLDISRQDKLLVKLLNDKEGDERLARKVNEHIIYILEQERKIYEYIYS